MGDEKKRDIWDTAKRTGVSINKDKGQKRQQETTSLFKAISVLSIMTFLHLNIYVTVFLMSLIMFLLPSCPLCLTYKAERIYYVSTQVSN
jgi:hypothetical protein